MASGISFEVNRRQLTGVQNLLQTYAASLGGDGRAELHRRWGIQGLNWVDQNFRTEGSLTGSPWAKLQPSTIVNRRKQSSNILQNTGGLRQSFTMKFDNEAAYVGSAAEVSLYHEFGTKGPYPIKPKNKKFLHFFAAGATQSTKAGKSKFAKSEVFSKGVIHPGLPARRMLPRRTDTTFMDKILTTARNWLKEMQSK